MSALDFLGQLSRMLPSAPAGNGLGEDLLRQRMQERTLQERQEREFNRSIASMYVDLSRNAKTGASRKQYMGMLEQHMGKLQPAEREALTPYLKGTPLDPVEEKKEFFRQTVGPEPLVTADFKENPLLYGEQVFAQKDYKARMGGFLTNVTVQPPRLLGGPDGQLLYRHNDGSVGVYEKEEMLAISKAKGLGLEPGELLARQGDYDTDTAVVQNGQQGIVRITKNVFDPSAEPKREFIPTGAGRSGAGSGASELKLPLNLLKEQTKIREALLTRDETEGSAYDTFKKSVGAAKSPEEAAQKFDEWRSTYQEYFPGSVMLLTGIEEAGFLGKLFGDHYRITEKTGLRVVKGVQWPDPLGEHDFLIYDPDSGNLVAPNGRGVDWRKYGSTLSEAFQYMNGERGISAERANLRSERPGLVEKLESGEKPDRTDYHDDFLLLDPGKYPRLSRMASWNPALLMEDVWGDNIGKLEGLLKGTAFEAQDIPALPWVPDWLESRFRRSAGVRTMGVLAGLNRGLGETIIGSIPTGELSSIAEVFLEKLDEFRSVSLEQ